VGGNVGRGVEGRHKDCCVCVSTTGGRGGEGYLYGLNVPYECVRDTPSIRKENTTFQPTIRGHQQRGVATITQSVCRVSPRWGEGEEVHTNCAPGGMKLLSDQRGEGN